MEWNERLRPTLDLPLRGPDEFSAKLLDAVLWLIR
jgi:hypothetical protein